MPQPLKVGHSIRFGPNKILDRPNLASEIGNVCANWNLIENKLMLLYALVMGHYLPKLEGYSQPTHPVAYQIFDSLNAFNPRIDLLEKLLVWRLSKDEVKYFRETIKPQLRRRFTERSVIVHGLWGTCDEYEDALILSPIYGNKMIYKIRDFQKVSERILEAHRVLGEFVNQVYKKAEKT